MIVNAHTHLYSALSPPFEHRPTFLETLQSHWWRLDRALDERSLRAAARLYAAEARLAGTDIVIDHHESPNLIEGSLDVIADACQDLGVAALVCYGATERNDGLIEAHRGLEECRRFILSNRRPLVRGAIGLHAAFTVSDDTIRAAVRLCCELDAPLHVHVAEDAIDRDGFARLGANGALMRGAILAHGVHLTPDEVREAEDLGCWLVQNPRSNHADGVGYASVLRVSSRVALGTDGFPSDMSEETTMLRAHETDEVIARRLAAGEELARELGFEDTGWSAAGTAALHDSRAELFDIDAIRAEAAIEAERLRERLNESQFVTHR